MIRSDSLIVENHKVLNLWKFYKLIIMKDESNQNVITFSILCSNLMCFSVLLLVLNISLHNFHAWVFLSLSVIFRCMAGPGLDRVSQTKYLLPWWCLKCSPRVQLRQNTKSQSLQMTNSFLFHRNFIICNLCEWEDEIN